VPSQIVCLPETTLDTLLHDQGGARSYAFAMRDMKAIESRLADGSRALRVHVDPLVHCPQLRDHFVDDVYALVLTSGAPGALHPVPPPPLSCGLAHHVLDEAETALQEFPALSGHEHLAITSAFRHARSAQPVARSLRRRSPANSYESALLAQAIEIQHIIAPSIPRLNRRLAGYEAQLQASGLQAGVTRLGLQAELGLRLRVDRAGGALTPRLFGKTRRCGLAGLMRTTFNQLGAFQKMAEAIHSGAVAGTSWVTTEMLKGLHAELVSTLPGLERAGRLRTQEMRIRSPFDGHVTVLEMPGHAVEAAFADFAGAFDEALWREIHPVIRTSLAHVELARIHPFSDGNGRLARLLMSGLLNEAAIPQLPLDAVFAWNRPAYLDAVGRAVRQHDAIGFVHLVLKSIDQAITAGWNMIRVLKPHCEHVRESLLALGASGRLALIASELAGSMVLGPDPQLIARTLHGIETSWYLNDSPQFDAVDAKSLNFTASGYVSETAYSSPVARLLMSAPLTAV
jgi:fido (protein-threonine AMPylation protein)